MWMRTVEPAGTGGESNQRPRSAPVYEVGAHHRLLAQHRPPRRPRCPHRRYRRGRTRHAYRPRPRPNRPQPPTRKPTMTDWLAAVAIAVVAGLGIYLNEKRRNR